MQRVGEFEKVSFEQFCCAYHSSDIKDEFDSDMQKMYDSILLPSRSTAGSAGYDFKAPFGFTLNPGETIKIPTGIRVKLSEGWWLGCLPRSGLGFRYRLQLDNTIGVIDSDYYYSDNQGHVFAKVTNDSNKGKSVSLEAGDGDRKSVV